MPEHRIFVLNPEERATRQPEIEKLGQKKIEDEEKLFKSEFEKTDEELRGFEACQDIFRGMMDKYGFPLEKIPANKFHMVCSNDPRWKILRNKLAIISPLQGFTDEAGDIYLARDSSEKGYLTFFKLLPHELVHAFSHSSFTATRFPLPIDEKDQFIFEKRHSGMRFHGAGTERFHGFDEGATELLAHFIRMQLRSAHPELNLSEEDNQFLKGVLGYAPQTIFVAQCVREAGKILGSEKEARRIISGDKLNGTYHLLKTLEKKWPGCVKKIANIDDTQKSVVDAAKFMGDSFTKLFKKAS